MEAEDGYNEVKLEAGSASGSMTNTATQGKFAPWNGNWHQWRATMEAAADLQGLGDAVQAGIALAANPEAKANSSALEQSKRLSSVLLLALCTGNEGVQSSIARDAFYENRNGIKAVTQLVKHFELTDIGCETDALVAEFHEVSLDPGTDPHTVYYKLQDIRRQANSLGEELSEVDIARRLTVALEKEYQMEVLLYRNSGLAGRKMPLQEFRTMIQHAHRRKLKTETTGNSHNAMMGLYAKEQCTYCDKKGHNEESCWEKRPESWPTKGKPRRKKQTIKCFKCGKAGHIKKECPGNSETTRDATRGRER